MDLKPEVYDLTVDLAKQTLVIDSTHFFIPLCLRSFLAVLDFWRAFGGIGSFMVAPLGLFWIALPP